MSSTEGLLNPHGGRCREPHPPKAPTVTPLKTQERTEQAPTSNPNKQQRHWWIPALTVPPLPHSRILFLNTTAPVGQLHLPLTSGTHRQLPNIKVHSPLGLYVWTRRSNFITFNGQRFTISKLGAELIYSSVSKPAVYCSHGCQKE